MTQILSVRAALRGSFIRTFGGVASVSLLLVACGGSGDGGGGLLDLDNLGGSGPAVLTLTCPNGVSPGSTVDGFLATLTDGRGKAVGNTFIGLSPSQGSIDAPPSQSGTFGANTDSNGAVPFALEVPGSAGIGTSIAIKATVTASRYAATQKCSVPVRGNNLVLTAPDRNTIQPIGSAYARPTQVKWTTAQGAGLQGNLSLEATNGGGFTFSTSYAGSTPFSVSTNDSGQLASAVYFVCGNIGAVTITARTSDYTLSDSMGVQCVDAPVRGTLTTDSSTLKSAQTPASTANLTFTVYGKSNQPLAKQSVSFSLASGAGGGELLQPASAITDSSGQATTAYSAGNAAGTVKVTACVTQDSSVCDSRTITVN